MPPRYAYWTILIDARPTAFRARDREELQPTLHQLRRKNTNVELRWFAQGRLWDSPEQAQWAKRNVPRAPTDTRGPDWRPGGVHKDPRAKYARNRKKRGPSPKQAPPPAEERGRGASPRPAKAGARPPRPPIRPGRPGRPRRPGGPGKPRR